MNVYRVCFTKYILDMIVEVIYTKNMSSGKRAKLSHTMRSGSTLSQTQRFVFFLLFNFLKFFNLLRNIEKQRVE